MYIKDYFEFFINTVVLDIYRVGQFPPMT